MQLGRRDGKSVQKGYSSSSRILITLKVDKGTVPLSLQKQGAR